MEAGKGKYIDFLLKASWTECFVHQRNIYLEVGSENYYNLIKKTIYIANKFQGFSAESSILRYETDSPNKVPGFDLLRKIWTVLNRIRTGNGRCNSMLFKWNSVESPSCECRKAGETIEHLINNCPIFKFQDGLRATHEVTESFLN